MDRRDIRSVLSRQIDTLKPKEVHYAQTARLAAHAGRYMTGAEVVVDGGHLCSSL
jgi:hypothetical protein